MGSHPANLILRFILEIVALISIGVWCWKQSEHWPRFVLAFGIPFAIAVIWGTFAVPNDPSRSGSAPVPVNGYLRLVIELGVFVFAMWVLYDLGWNKISLLFGLVVLAHYIISYDRILWLLSQ